MNLMRAALSPKKLGWEPDFYLVYLIFLFFQPLFDPERGWLDLGVIVLLLVLFFPAYFWTFGPRRSRVLWSIGVLALLGALGMGFNSGSSVFLIYAAAGAGGRLRPGQAVRVIVGVLALTVVSAVFSPIPLPYRVWAYGPAFLFAPLIGFLNMYQAEKARSNARLRLAQDEIEHLATIAERERIARDLHDLLGHTLSVITLKSELAGRLVGRDAARAQQEIQEVERISREALSEVRAAVSGYRATGFTAELAHAKLALEPAGVSFAFRGDPSVLTPLQESTLCLVLREAVTNIVRHAEATRCFVELSQENGDLRLEIVDNGRGMSRNAAGNGLRGMSERLQLLGGKLDVVSVQGTRLSIRLPKTAPRAGVMRLEPAPQTS
ncbi:sensor histidine kinase [soil metagenome]